MFKMPNTLLNPPNKSTYLRMTDCFNYLDVKFLFRVENAPPNQQATGGDDTTGNNHHGNDQTQYC